MDMNRRELRWLKSKIFHHKGSDCCLMPRQLPAGRQDDWSSVVLEVGVTESHKSLWRDAKFWLGASNGIHRAIRIDRINMPGTWVETPFAL